VQVRCGTYGIGEFRGAPEMKLLLHASDVTLLQDSRPSPNPLDVPSHSFEILHDQRGYTLTFDSHCVAVQDAEMSRLFRSISDTTHVDWEHSKDVEIQNTFGPLNRVIKCLTTTPSYQLFLAGFHIADAIGMLDLALVDHDTVSDSFRYLVGNLPWLRGKKGRLFILREGDVSDQIVRQELIANGKLFAVQYWDGDLDRTSLVDEKLAVPYATPIGFNTHVGSQTEQKWRDIVAFVRQHGGGYAE
jgi:hypothetical protein